MVYNGLYGFVCNGLFIKDVQEFTLPGHPGIVCLEAWKQALVFPNLLTSYMKNLQWHSELKFGSNLTAYSYREHDLANVKINMSSA